MFKYFRTIYLQETDATGVLYFSEQLKLCLEAFEAYLLSKGFTLNEMVKRRDFLIPIVHAQADFKAPLRVGDQVKISLSLLKTGTSSFTMNTRLFDSKRKIEVGESQIVHVAISKETGQPIPLPKRILSLLSDL